MGREIRRVPADWKHPKEKGRYIPLYDGNELAEKTAYWDTCNALWQQGKRHAHLDWPTKKPDQSYYAWALSAPVIDIEPENRKFTFEEWDGERPDPKDYTDFGGRPCTHFQLYENISEGTPVGPVCDTAEKCWPGGKP